MATLSNRADRFVQRLYTRGKAPTPSAEVGRKEVRDLVDKLIRRRSRLRQRILRKGS